MTASHIRYANASTGGVFVCSAYCNVCGLNRRLATLRTLAANLVMAGGLCASFDLGDEHAENRRDYFDNLNDEVEFWVPGCGRPSPTSGCGGG